MWSLLINKNDILYIRFEFYPKQIFIMELLNPKFGRFFPSSDFHNTSATMSHILHGYDKTLRPLFGGM